MGSFAEVSCDVREGVTPSGILAECALKAT